MSGRKYKPALFELLGTSTKPDEGAKLKTPEWFYGDTKTATEPLRRDTMVTKPTEVQAPAAKIPSPGHDEPRPSNETAKRYKFANPAAISQSFATRRVTFTVSYWLLALAILTMMVFLIVAYQLGQANPPVVSSADAIDGAELRSSGPLIGTSNTTATGGPRVDAAPPVPGTVAPRALPATGLTSGHRDTAASTGTGPAPPTEGIVLVICSSTNLRHLGPVQQYFNTSGIDTLIGRFEGRYVLYSRQVAPNSNDLKTLRDQVKSLGMHYNEKKAPNAPRFNAESFATAYAVNVDRIEKDL